MSELIRKLPLEGLSINHSGLTIRPVENRSKIMVQRSNNVTNSEMEGLSQKFSQAFGLELPLKVCDKVMSKDGFISALCLNPTSWVIVCDDNIVANITEWFEGLTEGKTITTSDMADQYICLNIEGKFARALLAKGCALDLSDKVFSKNHAARTLLAQANIVIWRNEEGGYAILFDVSLSNYLWFWLESAAKEFI